jgi:23S rRNA pseudouridine1911/1915/1917 synthase
MNPDPKNIFLNEQDTRSFAGQRLDVFIAAALQRSRNHAQSLLKRKLVRLNSGAGHAESSYRLRIGDTVAIEFALEPEGESPPAGEAIPLDILFEDDALLALNKQAGLVVHPAAGHASGTLVNALVHHLGSHLARRGGESRSGLVHRLDKDTSGVILIAKTDDAHERLAEAFARREVRKVYRALCRGTFRQASGSCKGAIARHPVDRKKMAVPRNPERGRAAWTDYRVVQQGKWGAEVECVLHTGRTHQIRVHLSHLGHPIWGDTLYGRQRAPVDGVCPSRQMLHAALLEIAHPLTGKTLRFEAELPEDYKACRERLLAK